MWIIITLSIAEINHYATIDTLRTAAYKALKENNWEKTAVKYLDISSYFQLTGDVDSLLFYSEAAYELADKYKLTNYKAHSLNHIGSYYNYTGNYDRALEYFHRALPFYMAENDSLRISTVYENIGKTHKDLGNYKEAITYLLKAADIMEKQDNVDIRPSIYITLGTVFYKVKDFESMYKYLCYARQLIEESDDLTLEHAILYNELGNYNDVTGDVKASEICYKKVVDVSRRIGWTLGESTGLSNLSDIYYQRGELDKALSNHLRILDIDKDIESSYGIVKDFSFISEIYLDKNMYKTAESYADSALAIAEEKSMASEVTSVLNLLSRIYYEQNRIKDAFDTFYLYHTYQDSLENLDYKKHISDLSEKYQLAVNERRLLEEQTEKKILKQRSLILLYALISLILIVLTFVILSFQRSLKSRYKNLILKQQLFRAQMNPHFMFNTLSAIQHYILKNETKLAAEYLGSYSRLMRLILESSDSELITLEKELDIVNIQLQLEQLRFGDKFVYEFKVQEDIELDEVYVPPMLLQPLVENSIKHGFTGLDYQGIIEIEVTMDDKHLRLIERDNGSGKFTSDFYAKSHALKIMKQRLEVLKNVKNIDTELTVSSNKTKGITTEIIIHNPKKLTPEL